MSNPLMLSIDCGTQSIRGLIFNTKGDLITKVKIDVPKYSSLKPGWAEIHPDIYFDNLCKICKTIKNDYPQAFDRIVGVTVTTIRDTIVNVDTNGKPLRESILWLDQRMAKCKEELSIPHKLLANMVGQRERVEKFRKEFKLYWIKENEPNIYSKTHKYLLLSGYINYKLTGEYIDSVASQIGHIPFDYKRKKWASWFDIKSVIFPIDRDKLPELINPGEIMGYISEEVSNITGLKEGLPVIASGSDKGCETLGCGCFELNRGSISLGSAVTIQTTTKKYFETHMFIPPYPGVSPNTYNPEVQISRGYWMISWFKKEFGLRERLEAEKLNVSPESLLDKTLNDIPPGSEGLLLQPYWGAEIKDPLARGAIIGFGDVHTRAHIYRAIIEGINYGLRDGIKDIEDRSNVKMENITISGGGSVSDSICQITADMLNRKIFRVQTYETSGLGAAIIGFVGLNIYDSVEEAVKNMVHYKEEFVPNPINVELYDKLYNKVYKKIYPRLKKLYKEIYQITNPM